MPIIHGFKREKDSYVAPCGRILRNLSEVYTHLTQTESSLTVHLFSFDPDVRIDVECTVHQPLISKDISQGQERKEIPVYGAIGQSLPHFQYNSKRVDFAIWKPPVNSLRSKALLPKVSSGCSCRNGCHECHHESVYEFLRLLKPVPSAIVECTKECSCGRHCLNRIAGLGINVHLQVIWDDSWKVRVAHDVPAGYFICIAGGVLLSKRRKEKISVSQDHGIANISYFFGKGKNANLFTQRVHIDPFDHEIPNVAYFTSRIVKAGEFLSVKK